jgi:hypothetical protein
VNFNHPYIHPLQAIFLLRFLAKSRETGWTCRTKGQTTNAYKTFVRKSEGKRLLGRVVADGIIILEWILGKQDENLWTGFMCSGKRPRY